ncbi:extracellular solute-binding protein [Aureibacillus halotolerans]|uniref:ABC-type glycerol-3-phosphate transport system substrate-binding protein n=1 Tax=Aureibacillus halotolerans TaxID=1508390 RepID=A0A4R6U8D3_9BACI|nr:extracellular solute-binding protein [Aureibacillus halotolerans]TDQ41039.1 ABC-type glycerol-3-phosphate transport system substrate-binding protein [Aureibacillus halotolerans]
MLRWLRKYRLSLIVISALIVGFILWNNNRGYDDTVMATLPDYSDIDFENVSVLGDEDIQSKLEPSFFDYYNVLNEEGVTDTTDFHLALKSSEYSDMNKKGTSIETNLGGETGEFVALTGQDGWVEYTFTVPENGFYQMGMSYFAMDGKRSSAITSVQVNGEYPFFQAKKLTFERMWKEGGDTWFDNQGNEFNPERVETFGWQEKTFRDSQSLVEEPLRFHLEAGEHTIRVNWIREPIAIGELHIFSPIQHPTYEEVRAQYSSKGYQPVQDVSVKIQAEEATLRSDPTLKRVEDREPLTEPFNPDAITLNTFGGSSWRNGGQWAEWEFDAPKSGLYAIGMRFGQWYINGIPTQRKIYIDGEVPFKEMTNVLYPYEQSFQMKKLGTKEEPSLFYLDEGTHTIRMEVHMGEIGGILETVRDTTRKMSVLGREVIRVTGTSPDPNIDWDLDGTIPHLIPRLHMMAKDVDNAIQSLYGLGVPQGSSEVSTLYEVRDTLLSMAEDTESIPARLESLNNLQSSIGIWINELSQQSLLLDYILIQSPDMAWPEAEAPWYVRAQTSAYDFFTSFTKDYSGIGNVYEDEEVLDVWVSRGRDWVQIIKQMIDEDFTPRTGIKVNVNVIPAQQMQVLLLANTSGLAPDVALGVEGELPIDFAVRNALVDLGEFPDYEDVAKRFRPGALIPYEYNDGHYALPENQNFYMLFYRKDIMEELGVTEEEIPETWEEVMELIPLLQQNGMDFYYPHAPNNTALAINEFSPFLFQHGGDLYKEDGMESALNSPEALEAFEMWTGLFTNYKIEKQADFYNRFRSGEMPIGVADYFTYILLSTAAPELTGWWEMVPMPGIQQEDGQINRSTGGLGQTGIIFKDTDMKDESWEFMKWWTGADAQEQFGSELEALLGVEARWNTANIEALKRLPWDENDIDSILEQWKWFREREVVLGGYFTTRHIANIWNEVVLNGKIPREAVEEGVKEINKELRKKREEFGLDVSKSEGGDD